MSDEGRVYANKSYLCLVCTTTPGQRKQLIHTATKDQVDCFSEIADNVLKRNVPITPKQLAELRKHKRVVKILVDRGTPWRTKRSALEQSGGFPPLLALLAPIIGGALGAVTDNLVSKAMSK